MEEAVVDSFMLLLDLPTIRSWRNWGNPRESCHDSSSSVRIPYGRFTVPSREE